MGLVSMLAVFLMALCSLAWAAEEPGYLPTALAQQPIIHVEVDLRPTTLEGLIGEASVILVGRVEAIGDLTHPEVVRTDPLLSMEVTISVSRWIKGEGPDGIVLIAAQQDTTVAVYSPPPPRFAVDEVILLMGSPWKSGYYQTVGWHRAKYRIVGNKIAGSDVLLEDLIQQIQQFLAGVRSAISLNLPGHPVSSTLVEEMTWGQVKMNVK